MYLLNIVTSFKKEGLLFMPLSGLSMSVFLLLFLFVICCLLFVFLLYLSFPAGMLDDKT